MLSTLGKFLLLIVAFHVSFVATVQEAPATAPLTKIKVGYPSPSASMYPLFVTKEAGLFEKHGLDADLIYVQGVQMMQVHSTGQLDFTTTSGVSWTNSKKADS